MDRRIGLSFLLSFAIASVIVVMWVPIFCLCQQMVNVVEINVSHWLPHLRRDLMPEPAERLAYLLFLSLVAIAGLLFVMFAREVKELACIDEVTLSDISHWKKRTMIGIASAVVLVLVYLALFPGRYLFLFMCEHHFGIVHYPFVMQDLGSPQINQYGAYFLFLRPWCMVFGSSMASVLTLFGLLLVISFVAVQHVVRIWCDRRPVIWIVFVCSLFIIWPAASCAQVYVQYHPIRTFFPMISLALWAQVLFNASSEARKCYRYLTAVLAGMAPIWNVDSGIVVLLSSSLFLILSGARGERFWCLLLELFCGLVALTASYFFAALEFHDSLWLFKQMSFQRLFYIDGFFMLPMGNIFYSGAALILFVEISSFLFGCYQFRRYIRFCDSVQFKKGIFQIASSIMALGLFAYYQGRSHMEVLRSVSWIAFFLLALMVNDGMELYRRCSQNGNGRRTFVCFRCVAWVFLPLIGIFLLCTVKCHATSAYLFLTGYDSEKSIDEEIENLRDISKNNGVSTVMVVSDKWQSYVLQKLRLSPGPGQRCLTEVFFVEQEEEIVRHIEAARSGECIVFLKSMLRHYCESYPGLPKHLSSFRKFESGDFVMYISDRP